MVMNLKTAKSPAVYASWGMLPLPMQDSLPAGWLAFLHLFPPSWIYPDAISP